MVYRVLADIVVVVHFAFVVFAAVGGLLALRWPWVLWLHVPAVAWSVLIVTFNLTCPLTPLERELRALAGDVPYEEPFIERYVEGVLYPSGLERQAQALGALLVVGSWIALAVRRRRRSTGDDRLDRAGAGAGAVADEGSRV